MLMLQLYLDDSGTDDEAPVVTLGGYLASAAGWERFEHFAAPMLLEEGIRDCLHAVAFHHTDGDFEQWDGHRKSRFVRRLYAELAASKAIGMTFSARKRVYDDRRAELNVNHQISAYGFCFGGLINAMARKDWGRDALVEHGCALLIESGNKHEGDIRRSFHELSKKYDLFRQMFPSLSFVDKRSSVAIQMADFLAYHDRRQLLHAERGGDHSSPPPDGPAMMIAKDLVKHSQIIATEFYEK
jgi:hypothetical protein